MYLQFKKGILELCSLAMLKEGDRYGYDVASELSSVINISDGSVYPVLRRLKQDGYVSSYLVEASGGPPRKYYTITDAGQEMLEVILAEWHNFSGEINKIIKRKETSQ